MEATAEATDVERLPAAMGAMPPAQLKLALAAAKRTADFEFERVAAFVAHTKCARLALQFPDALLALSPAVAMELEEALRILFWAKAPEIYVLGDPAPGDSVDCVAAAHVDADAIVHYGPECLSPPPEGAPPVLFVVGPRPEEVDVAATARRCAAVLEAVAKSDDDEAAATAAPVLVVAAPEYAEWGAGVANALGMCCNAHGTATRLPNHVVYGPGEEPWRGPPDESRAVFVAGLPSPFEAEADLRARRVVLLGRPGSRLEDEVALRCAGCVGGCVAVVDPADLEATTFDADAARRRATRALAKRHHALSRCRRAARWGVVAAAGGRLKDAKEVTDRCDAALRAAGRSSYVLAVGPVTPTKLANFAELEAFVVVGADHGLLDALARESNAPLISPNELAVVLGDAEWLPEDEPFYSCRLGDVHVQAPDAAAADDDDTQGADDDDDDDDAPAFDLSAGHSGDAFADYRRKVDLAYEDDAKDDDGGAIVEWKSAAADFLSKRDWQGLEVQKGQTPVRAAVQGRDGVASGYAQEREEPPPPPPP